jgi:Mrp family chromosome partitioning ATPase
MILPLSAAVSLSDAALADERMKLLLDELRQRFSYVILDTPPLLAIAETRVLATMVDTVVMVVRWRHTADHAVRTALHMLRRNRVNLGGIVLNSVDMQAMARFGRGDAASYHRKYQSYYS